MILISMDARLASVYQVRWDIITTVYPRNNHSPSFNIDSKNNQKYIGHKSVLRLCKGGPTLPSKFKTLLPAPQIFFITAPQIKFACSLNEALLGGTVL